MNGKIGHLRYRCAAIPGRDIQRRILGVPIRSYCEGVHWNPDALSNCKLTCPNSNHVLHAYGGHNLVLPAGGREHGTTNRAKLECSIGGPPETRIPVVHAQQLILRSHDTVKV